MPSDLDPFVPPAPPMSIAEIHPRSRVVVQGTVVAVTRAPWIGGDTTEVTIEDGTGRLVLAFFGRARAGIEPGCRLVAAGRVVVHTSGPLLMNPLYWLEPAEAAVTEAAAFQAAVKVS